LPPSRLSAADVTDIDGEITHGPYTHGTKVNKSNALRRVLRWLWEQHGAPKLDDEVHRYACIRPRNVTATREQIDMILDAAPPHLRLWLLFCSDLAIRSTTAANLSSEHYDEEKGELRFTTKGGARLTLPVTEEIRRILLNCRLDSPVPFVRQLWAQHHSGGGNTPSLTSQDASTLRFQFRTLCHRLEIAQRLIPHDLRRTAAVAMYTATGDLRDAQALLGHSSLRSTIWYLDHDLRPVKRSTLELIKRSNWRKENSA
jgi:integrase